MKINYYLALLIILSISIRANEFDAKFNEANELYTQGKYSSAIDLYENLHKSGVQNAELFYNLGNSYYKIKDYSYAILNYEKAKKISPNDEDIDYNIRIANLQIVDKIEPVPEFFFNSFWKSLINLASSCTWSWIFIILFCLSFVLFSGFYFFRSSAAKKLFFALASLTIIISILVFVVSMQSDMIQKSHDSAIIFEPSIYVKASPDEKSTDLFILHEGTKVQLLDELGEWNKIKIADGNVGWLPKTAFQII